MRIGYNEATAMKCSTLEKDLELCEKVGFDDIEIRLDMLEAYLREHTVRDLQTFFATHRLRPGALNALYLYPDFLGEGDDDVRQEALLQKFLSGCRIGQAIGSHLFIIVPPLQSDPHGGPWSGTREEAFEDCTRILRKLGKLAEPFEMNLCFELVGFDRSSVRTIKEADSIIQAVDAVNVGFVFDSYNIFLNGKNNDFSAILDVPSEKIFDVHLMNGEDVPEAEMGQDKRCFCNTGVVDLDAFLQVLNQAGFGGTVSIETFRPSYWERDPAWGIETAYRTTEEVMERNGCLDLLD